MWLLFNLLQSGPSMLLWRHLLGFIKQWLEIEQAPQATQRYGAQCQFRNPKGQTEHMVGGQMHDTTTAIPSSGCLYRAVDFVRILMAV